MTNKDEKGAKFYSLRKQGLSNVKIGEMYGMSRLRVGVIICEYRKKYNLPPLNKIQKFKKTGRNNMSTASELYDEMRANNHKQAVRRDDGVLVCPTRYAGGYGYNSQL